MTEEIIPIAYLFKILKKSVELEKSQTKTNKGIKLPINETVPSFLGCLGTSTSHLSPIFIDLLLSSSASSFCFALSSEFCASSENFPSLFFFRKLLTESKRKPTG